MLRPYQVEPVSQVCALLSRNMPTLLVSPTGAGKTVMAAEILARTIPFGHQFLFVGHRQELLAQAHRALSARGINHHPLFTLMSPQRALRSGKTNVDLLIIDEAHRATAKTYGGLLAKYPNSKLLGMTATPIRTDGAGLGEIFKRIVQTVGVAELIGTNYLCPFHTFSATDEDLSRLERLKRTGGDYNLAELGALMSAPRIVGNIVSHYKQRASGRPALAFVPSRKNAVDLCSAFSLAGLRSASLDGEASKQTRERLLVDMSCGRLDVLVSVDLFTEGWDCPTVSCIIHARPTVSLTLWLQSVGRGLRPHSSKQDLVILDHAGNYAKHGSPDTPREWRLDSKPALKKGQKVREGNNQMDKDLIFLESELEEKAGEYWTATQCAALLRLKVSKIKSWMDLREIPETAEGYSRALVRQEFSWFRPLPLPRRAAHALDDGAIAA